MAFFHMKMSVANLPANPAPGSLMMCTAMDHLVLEGTFFPRLAPPNYHTPYVRSLCAMCGSLTSSRRVLRGGVTSSSYHVQQNFDFDDYFLSELGLDSPDEQSTSEEKGGRDAELSEVRSMFQDAETKPAIKHGNKGKKHGNKGKVPWNKGRKHSAETRALIKQRTREGLRISQVNKSREGSSPRRARKHTAEGKAKISSKLRRLWNKRLKSKRLGEKFFLAWAGSIAKAAKDGGLNECMLPWNSYSEIEQDIDRQQLQIFMEKKMKAEKQQSAVKKKAEKLASVAKEKAEKLASVAKEKAEKSDTRGQMKNEREQKAKAREQERREDHETIMKNNEHPSVKLGLMPKQKFVKIRRKKAISVKVINGRGGAQISSSQIWERIDLKLTERELKRDSLADQIRAARNKRDE